MISITDLDRLAGVVDAYMQHDAFAFDVETLPQDPEHDAYRGDWQRNRVVWLSLATQGRADVIPLGHPNGEFVRRDFPLNAEGLRRIEENKRREAEGKKPLTINPKYHYLTDVRKATTIWTPPPKQLSWGDDVRRILRPLFFSDRLKVGQNIKFDIKSIAKHFGGEQVPGPYADTKLASWLIDVRRTGFLDLGNIAKREVEYDMVKGVGRRIEEHSFSEVEKYSWIDSKYTWLAWRELEQQFAEHGLTNMWRLEQDVMDSVIRMEMTGAPVAVERLRDLDTYLRRRIEEMTADVWRLSGQPFNIDSNVELSRAMFAPKSEGGQGLKPTVLTDGGKKKRDRGEELTYKEYSTAEKALQRFQGKNAMVDSVLLYAEYKKLHSGFVLPYLGGQFIKDGRTETRESLLVNGRIFATFQQDGAETGRFASKGPNLQQVPSRSEDGKKVRALFSVEEILDQGLVIVQADYSQIEPRILTDLSGEPALLDVYLNGGDIYTALADPFNLDRGAGKVLFLSVAYGTGPDTLATAVKIPLKSAKDIIYQQFPEQFPAVDRLKKRTIREAKRRQPVHVRTLLGRRRYLPDLYSRDDSLRRRAERQAFNTLIQGSAADIMKVALVRVDKLISPLGGRMFATVHDEILALAPADKAEDIASLLREGMEGVRLLKHVPLVAETKIVNNWAEAK